MNMNIANAPTFDAEIPTLTTVDVARITNTTTGALRALRKRGRGPRYHLVGDYRVRYTPTDVKTWALGRAVETSS